MDVFVLICGALKRSAQSRAWATILRPKFFNFNMLLYATLFALKLNKDGYLFTPISYWKEDIPPFAS